MACYGAVAENAHLPITLKRAVRGGGLAVLLGAPVPLANITMAIVHLTAMFTVHLHYGLPEPATAALFRQSDVMEF